MILDAQSKRLLSRAVLNDESELLSLLGDMTLFSASCCGRTFLGSDVHQAVLGIARLHNMAPTGNPPHPGQRLKGVAEGLALAG